jgi:type VI secretion system protein ImpK
MRLIDNFMPLIGYVVLLRDLPAANRPPYQQVRGDIQRLLTQSNDCVRGGEASAEDYDLARFIVCAWVDEVLLASDWSDKGQWQREQLQRVYYNTTDAGVEAFEKLNQLGLEQKDVREVYYVCLSLGFRGRFINPGDEFLLDQLRSSNLKLLTGGSANAVGAPPPARAGARQESRLNTEPMTAPPDALFPEAFPAGGIQAAPDQRKFSLPYLLALAGPIVLFAVLHLVFRFSLDSVADKLF